MAAALFGLPRRLGIAAAIAAIALDQAVKLWLLYGFDLPSRGRVPLLPTIDLVLAWNTGISYGLFQQTGPLGQWALCALKGVAVVLLCLWLARTSSRLAGLALGLIVGGAIGNAIDRVVYGAVVDFALFHLEIGEKSFNWYVFNLADVAIVAGVIALLYDSCWGYPPQKRPDPGRYGSRAVHSSVRCRAPRSAGQSQFEQVEQCVRPKPQAGWYRPRRERFRVPCGCLPSSWVSVFWWPRVRPAPRTTTMTT